MHGPGKGHEMIEWVQQQVCVCNDPVVAVVVYRTGGLERHLWSCARCAVRIDTTLEKVAVAEAQTPARLSLCVPV